MGAPRADSILGMSELGAPAGRSHQRFRQLRDCRHLPAMAAQSQGNAAPANCRLELSAPAHQTSAPQSPSSTSINWRNLPSAQLEPVRASSLSRPAQIIPSVLRSTRKPE